MNYAESLTYAPTGRGLVWMVHNLPAWLNPQPKRAKSRSPEFAATLASRITEEPRTINQIYELLPAHYRTTEDYKNLDSQLRRLVQNGRIKRKGALGDYRYWR